MKISKALFQRVTKSFRTSRLRWTRWITNKNSYFIFRVESKCSTKFHISSLYQCFKIFMIFLIGFKKLFKNAHWLGNICLKMTKKMKKLEKDTTMYRQRWESSNKALLTMAEEVFIFVPFIFIFILPLSSPAHHLKFI